MGFHTNSISSSSDIRLCIFLIASVCVGLLALLWAFRHIHHHRGRISVFIAILLLGDLVEVTLDLYTVAKLLLKLYWNHNKVVQFWSGLHLCGFILHQLVALERALPLKYPQCPTHILSCPCYIIVFVLVLAFSIVNSFIFDYWVHGSMYPIVNMYISLFSLGTSLAPLSLLAVSFTNNCKAFSTPVIRLVYTVAIFTFVMLYLPFMLFICVNLVMGEVHMSWYVMCLCLMSLRVISDPVLCVLVCRGNLRDVQKPETHTEPKADNSLNLSFISSSV